MANSQYFDEEDAIGAALAPTFNPQDDERTGISQPPDDGAVRSISPAAVMRQSTPAATTRSGDPTSAAPSQPSQPAPGPAQRIQDLETQRASVAGQAPDPNAPQYKPGLGTKIFRGIQGVAGGIARGGVIGGLASGLSTDYNAPAGTYGKDVAKNQQQLAGIDQQVAGDKTVLGAQNEQSQIEERANKAPDTVTTADGIKQWNPQTRKYDIAVGDAPKPKLPEGEMPLGQTAGQLQKSLEDRYQVLNPGKSLPPEYQLPKDATQKDYDRIDKSLEGVERATGTKQQQEASRTLQQQGLDLRRQLADQSRSDRLDRESKANNTEIDREAKQYGASHSKASDQAGTQLEKIDDARNMVTGNAEAQALGIPKVLTALVGGQGTGVRITTPELNAIAHARGWSGDFEGTLNRISGKGQLTGDQQKQLVQILDDAKTRIRAKQQIHNDALDKINGAGSRDEIIQADKNARQSISDLESGKASSSGGSSGKEVSMSDARSLPAMKGKNDDQIRAAIKAAGHQVKE